MKKRVTLVSAAVIILLLVFCFLLPEAERAAVPEVDTLQIPAYSGEPYVILNNNIPNFTEADITAESFESYGGLDTLERCTQAVACVGRDLMPTQDRERISQVKPTGWHTTKYDFVDGENLYNRCHLIAFQLTGENANDRNLITGTRYMNTLGMQPFENMVADYVKETGNHVLYRVIPVFEGSNLVASGVTMEGYSVEDNGEGICFYAYAYNVQPGVVIDYATGDNHLADAVQADGEQTQTYVANMANYKFHSGSCPQADSIKQENREVFETTRSQMLAWSFVPAGCCKP